MSLICLAIKGWDYFLCLQPIKGDPDTHHAWISCLIIKAVSLSTTFMERTSGLGVDFVLNSISPTECSTGHPISGETIGHVE